MKLISKERINSKYRKKYDQPKTPCQRLLASCDMPEEAKQKLIVTYQSLNPFILQRKIESKLKSIFKLIRI